MQNERNFQHVATNSFEKQLNIQTTLAPPSKLAVVLMTGF